MTGTRRDFLKLGAVATACGVLGRPPLEAAEDPALGLIFPPKDYPIPPDAKLVQLQKDVEQSTKQLSNKRLTVAQDLAWALINSPAFLFNH